MRKITLFAALVLLVPVLSSAQAARCLLGGSSPECDPSWVPPVDRWPDSQGAAQVLIAKTSTVQVAGGQWHVRLDLVTSDHPGLVQVYRWSQGEAGVVHAWSSGSTKSFDFLFPLSNEQVYVEWIGAGGEVHYRTVTLRLAGTPPAAQHGVTSPWWLWWTGRGSHWPGETPIW